MRLCNNEEIKEKSQMVKFSVLMPLYDDWDSALELLKEISEVCDKNGFQVHKIFIVDDFSSDKLDFHKKIETPLNVEIITLKRNLGHQRAIAIGLCHILKTGLADKVIVLDSDGEDNPDHFVSLLNCLDKNPDSVVVASRSKRLENWWFRLFYKIFKLVFFIVTGARLDFGNFSLITRSTLESIVLQPELWNNYPATILRKCKVVVRVPLDRSRRKFGNSKLNFTSFIQHGFGAISVYADIALIRILIGSIFLGFVVSLFALITIILRIFSSLTLPGWSSLILVSLFSMVTLTVLIVLLSVIQFIEKRNTSIEFPIDFYSKYISKIELLDGKDTEVYRK